jgi:hypothetical protein
LTDSSIAVASNGKARDIVAGFFVVMNGFACTDPDAPKRGAERDRGQGVGVRDIVRRERRPFAALIRATLAAR